MSLQPVFTFRQKPATRLGWWAVGLGGVYVLLFILTAIVSLVASRLPEPRNVMPSSGMLMLLLGLASGVVALAAILRNHERSWLVWLALLPGILGVLAILGEFLLPH